MIPRPPPLESLPAGTRLVAGVGISTIVPDLDFETYSAAGFVWDDTAGRWRGPPNAPQGKKGLFAVGAAVYTEDQSCEVLSLYYDLKDGRGRRHWRPGLPPPADLIDHVVAGGLLEAWNVGFERWVWENVCVPRMGWPQVRPEQWRCAMAKARAHALPGGLDKVGEVLGLSVTKDKDGKRLLDKFSVPRNPTKADPRLRIWPRESPEDAARLYAYNETDIIVEAEASAVIPDLPPEELRFWQDDQAINKRGVRIDLDSVHACIAIIEQAHRRYGDELQALAGCAPSEVAQLKGWLHGRGVHMDSMDEENVEAALSRPTLPPEARRALEIRAAVGSASVKKVFAMRNQASRDGRLHDLYTYHGARTGRPTGNGPQPTNLPKAGPRVYRCECGRHHGAHTMWCHWCGKVTVRAPGSAAEWSPDAMADALEAIGHRSLDWLEVLFGDAMLTIAGVLRGLFVASPGHELVSSDFTAIEGVVIACMAGEAWRIEAFAQDRSLYVESASRAFNIPIEEFTKHKAETGQHHPMRQIGKGMELGLGFGGWITALRQFDVEGNDEELKRYVLAWREASPAIVELWGGQMRRGGTWTAEFFGLEGAAVQAVERPGEIFHVKRLDGEQTGIRYLVRGDVLYCRVPSGGLITYHRPRIEQSADSWRGLSLSFEGWNTNPKSGPQGWHRMNTYSGKLAENCIAEGTDVLTARGWIAIESVQRDDLVHDGIEFVPHAGTIFKSVAPCVAVDGVHMTPDHEVLTNDGWQEASKATDLFRPTIRDAVCARAGRFGGQGAAVDVPVRLRIAQEQDPHGRAQRHHRGESAELRMPHRGVHGGEATDARDDEAPGVCRMGVDDRQMLPTNSSSVGELRGSRDHGLRKVARVVRELLGRHGADLSPGAATRQKSESRGLLPGKLQLGDSASAVPQQTEQRLYRDSRGAHDCLGSGAAGWDQRDNVALPDGEELAARKNVLPIAWVYDIVNAGPRHRFVVRGQSGPFIVHNCVQKVARDIQMNAIARLHDAGYPIVMHTYDEVVAEVPIGTGSVEHLEQLMTTPMPWTEGWPIKAAGGWRGERYRKG